MRKLLLLALLSLPTVLAAQPVRQGVRFVTSLPATCIALGSASADSPVSYQGVVYQCTATNTWSAVPNTSGSLTSGRIPFVTTGGVLTDSSTLTYNGTTTLTIAPASNSTAQISLTAAGTGQNTFNFTTAGGTAIFNMDASGNMIFRESQASMYFDYWTNAYWRVWGNGQGIALQLDASGRATLFSQGASLVPLTLKGASSQSSDLLQAKDNSSNILSGISSQGSLYIGSGTPASVIGATSTHGQNITFLSGEESLTIAAAATTDSTMSLPANAVILSVSVRVTTVIPTAATFTVTGATSATVFNTANVSTAAGTTDPGTKAGAFYNSTSQKIRITPNLTPGTATGVVRLTVHYYVVTPPTS